MFVYLKKHLDFTVNSEFHRKLRQLTFKVPMRKSSTPFTLKFSRLETFTQLNIFWRGSIRFPFNEKRIVVNTSESFRINFTHTSFNDIWLDIYTPLQTHTNSYIHTDICVCMCVRVFVYVCVWHSSIYIWARTIMMWNYQWFEFEL